MSLWALTPRALISINIMFWSFDLVLQCLTGCHAGSRVEMRPWKTAAHYARTWLILDLAVLLLDIAFAVFGFNSSARTFRLLRLLRLLRLARLHKFLDAFKSLMRSNTSELLDMFVKIFRLTFTLVCLCHYTACAWFGLADMQHELVASSEFKGTWVEQSGLSGETPFFSYIVALHWSITQFTPATNNVFPVNATERAFAVVVVLVGFVTFSAFLGSMMSTLNEIRSLKQSRVRERQHLIQFFRNRRIPVMLAAKVLQLFDTEGDTRRDNIVESDLPILQQLPTSIKVRLRREYYLPFLQNNGILGGLYYIDPRCFLRICYDAMSDHRYMGHQDVFLDGVQTDTAYAVIAGKLKYYVFYQKSSLASLTPGDWLSEHCMWVKWTPQGTLVAKACSSLVQLNCSVFRKTVLNAGGDLHSCLRCCAILYAHKMEYVADNVTDLSLPSDFLEDVLERAQKFSHTQPPCQKNEDVTGSGRTNFFLRGILRRSQVIDSDDED